MTEPQAERRSVDRSELRALETLFTTKFDSHEKLDEQRFDAMQKLSDERQAVITESLTAIRTNAHNLNNKLTPIFALPDRVDALVDDLKNVPRKEDLAHMSQSFTAQIGDLKNSINSSRDESNKRLTRTIAIISICVTVVLAAIQIALKLMG